MRIAIHQPNYLPWPGFFKKMSLCDVFVFLDDVQLNKESFTRRVKVRHPEKANSFIWMTVPLRKSGMQDLIQDLEIDRNKEWAMHHLALVEQSYRSTPGWHQNGSWIQALISRCENESSLADMNIFLIQEIATKLGIGCRFLRSGNLPVAGKADRYTYALVKELGGTTYIRGKGEQRYAKSPEWGSDPDLTVLNIDYTTELKNDPTGTWRNGYSIIDLLLMSAQSPESYFG